MEDRGIFIDTLKGVLDGRPPSRVPTNVGTAAPPAYAPGTGTDVEKRLARVTTSPAWKFLEVLSLAFVLGIGAAAAYFSTRRSSAVPD